MILNDFGQIRPSQCKDIRFLRTLSRPEKYQERQLTENDLLEDAVPLISGE